MKRVFHTILFAFILLFVQTVEVKAQPGGGGPGGGGDPDVPIGGIELLLLAGAGLGAKKVYDRRKKTE